MSKKTGGGSATHAGTDYQNRVQAWVCVHIVGEQAASPPWHLPASARLEFIRCETSEPVDDFFVRTSNDGLVYVQVKRRVNLTISEHSDLASVIDQFVAQFLKPQNDSAPPQPLDRPLDPNHDRLVLTTSSQSSQRIRFDLQQLCNRARDLGKSECLDSLTTNAQERKTLETVLGHVERSWKRYAENTPTQEDILQLLALIHAQTLDVDDGQRDETSAKNLLRSPVLKDADQSDAAWSELVRTCAGYSRDRSGGGRKTLREVLTRAGFDIQAVP